jgi:hypothetical protein
MRLILFILAALSLSAPAHAGQVQRQSAPGMSREYVVISDNQIEGPVIRSGTTVLRGKLTVSPTGYDSFQMYDGVFKLIARHLVEVDFYTGEPLPTAISPPADTSTPLKERYIIDVGPGHPPTLTVERSPL